MRACVHSAVHLRRSVVGRSRSATGPARTTLSRRGSDSRAYRADLRVRPRGAREIAIGKRAGEKTDFFFRLPPWETTRTARAARARCSSRCAPTRGCSATLRAVAPRAEGGLRAPGGRRAVVRTPIPAPNTSPRSRRRGPTFSRRPTRVPRAGRRWPAFCPSPDPSRSARIAAIEAPRRVLAARAPHALPGRHHDRAPTRAISTCRL